MTQMPISDKLHRRNEKLLSRHLREESTHDSAVHTYEDDLTRLIRLNDPSKYTNQKAHDQYQSHSHTTIGIEVGKESQWQHEEDTYSNEQ